MKLKGKLAFAFHENTVVVIIKIRLSEKNEMF